MDWKELFDFRFKRMLCAYICCVLLVGCAGIEYLAWVGLKPSEWHILFLTIEGCIGIILVDRIPFVHKLLENIFSFVYKKICDIFKFIKRNWKKLIISIGCAFIIGILLERLMDKGNLFSSRKFGLFFVSSFLILFLILFHRLLRTHIEAVVLVALLSVGSLMALALPIGCGIAWDDEAHYANILGIAHYLDDRFVIADNDILTNYVNTILARDIYNQASHNAWVEHIDGNGYIETVSRGKVSPALSNGGYYPGVVGTTLGRAFHLPYHIIFIMGRFANMLVYAMLMYFAMKRLKSGKMLVAVVSMLPVMCLQATTYSRDFWLHGFVILGFSAFFGEIQKMDKEISTWDVFVIVAAITAGVALKPIYVILLFVCLFMPKKKFKTKKGHVLYILFVLLAIAYLCNLFLTPFLHSDGSYGQDNRGGEEVSTGSQFGFIMGQPLAYTKILLRFVGHYISYSNAKFEINHMAYLGFAPYPVLTMLLLIFVVLTDRDECDKNLTWYMRFIVCIGCFGAICMAATTMYLAFTPYMASDIKGCQYRYIFIVYFMSLYVLGSANLSLKLKQVGTMVTNKIGIKNPIEIYRGLIIAVSSFIVINAMWVLQIKTF